MTGHDEHFIEVFDRKIRGEASEQELAELRAHADQCSSCALQMSLSADLAGESVESATDRLADNQAINAVMRQTPLRPKRRFDTPWMLAVAAVLIAGAAGASGLLSRLGASSSEQSQPPVKVIEREQSAPAQDRHSVEKGSAKEEESNTPQNAAPVAQATPPVPQPKAKTSPSAADLFSEANKLRREGQSSAAIAAYRKLQQQFPVSPQARQSFTTLGWLLLDLSRSKEALAQFDGYLKGGGAVSEDALAGRALALQRLGRRAEERQTLQTLVQRYPNSANAARAKQRLAELH